jgi:hypothetical protein
LIILGAAQLGFVEAAGQKIRHKDKNFEREYTDPKHLLALDGYFAGLNRTFFDQKTKVIRELEAKLMRPLRWSETETIWAMNGMNNKTGEINIQPPRTLSKPSNMRTRPLVCKPDMDRFGQVAEIGFTGHDAEVMGKAQFVLTKLPLARAAYSRFLDIDKVLFGPNETWGPLPKTKLMP